MFDEEEMMKKGSTAAEDERRNELRKATLSREVPTVVADTGATAACVKPANA